MKSASQFGQRDERESRVDGTRSNSFLILGGNLRAILGTNLVEPRFLPKREILFSIFRSTDVSALVEFHLWKEVQGRGRGKKKVRKKETNGSPFFFLFFRKVSFLRHD